MILDSALAIGLALPPATPVQLDIAPTDPLSRVVPQLERAIAGLARMRSIHLTPDAITVRAYVEPRRTQPEADGLLTQDGAQLLVWLPPDAAAADEPPAAHSPQVLGPDGQPFELVVEKDPQTGFLRLELRPIG